MAKVHITLVGGQREPIYKIIMHNSPDRVLFIYSNETEKYIVPIKELVKKHSAHVPEFHQELFNPTKLQKIRSKLKRLFEDSNGNKYFTIDDEVTVNLTGGTKPWSILFFDYFKDRENVSLQLIDQNDTLTNLVNYESIKVQVPLEIEDRFILQGLKIKTSTVLDRYSEADLATIPDMHEMRKYNHKHFLKLTKSLSEHPNQVYVEFEGSSLRYNKNDDRNKCNIVCQLSGNGGSRSWKVISPNIRRLITNTGWFEVEVARLLHRLYPQAPILLNCKLKYTSDKTRGEKNELDIVMIINGKLLCVECKTQVASISDVNKFYEVVTRAGQATKPIYFTLDEMNEAARENCNVRSIPYFTTSEKEDEIVNRINEYLVSSNA